MDTASANEILEYLTRVMRGEEGGGVQAGMKAAELLGKRLALYEKAGDELPPPVIVDDVSGEEPGRRAARGCRS